MKEREKGRMKEEKESRNKGRKEKQIFLSRETRLC